MFKKLKDKDKNKYIKKNKYIIGVAGNSGGHIIPTLTYLQNITKADYNYKIIFFSTNKSLDQNILKKYKNINYTFLKVPNFPKLNILKYPIFILRLISSLFQSFRIIYKYRPEKVVSTGSYISIPVCLAAWIQRVPIELFELNAVPGKAINCLKFFASKIMVCFEDSLKFFPKQKRSLQEYPLRFLDNKNINKSINKNKNFKLSKFVPKYKTIFIIGGSQGSRFINSLIIKFIEKNKDKNIQVIHQTGGHDLKATKRFYKNNFISSVVFDYDHDIKKYYQIADLIIARAGAGTLFELKFFKKRSIIIPLETKSSSHQINNAESIQKMAPNLFKIVNQKEISDNIPNFFSILLKELFI